jgi:nitrite reductase/ring-hydroxylating ferredoxin subunit
MNFEDTSEMQSVVSSWRNQIPAQGLREYWYPAVQAKKIGTKRPVGVRLIGEDIVFFRDKQKHIVAMQDLCAHRGAKLSKGVCHFPGTIACPYHGWTYDADGKCVAALIEGAGSHIPSANIRLPVKHVKELRGIVWIWMGNGQPVPLEEDVPEEFLDPQILIITGVRVWPVNWRPLIENAIDGHAPYVHRNAITTILFDGMGGPSRKVRPILTREGKGVALVPEGPRPASRQVYPGLGVFPKFRWRKCWSWIFKLRSKKFGTFTGKPYTQEIVLPGIARLSHHDYSYVRWGVPVDDTSVRNFYWYAIKGSWVWKLWFCIYYSLFLNWARNYNFSNQDRDIVGEQDYSVREKLSQTDAVIIQWRKIILHGFNADRVNRVRSRLSETSSAVVKSA